MTDSHSTGDYVTNDKSLPVPVLASFCGNGGAQLRQKHPSDVQEKHEIHLYRVSVNR